MISLPRPCNEAWDAMNNTEKGKFCANCQKEVIDFAYMTDDEIANYIKSNTSPFCGSFQHSQLNRVIDTIPKRGNYYRKKIAASIMAILSFRYTTSPSPQTSKPTVYISPKNNNSYNHILSHSEYVISGYVSIVPIESNPYSRVAITIGNEEQKYFPDSSGWYKITLNESQIKEYTVISFSHPQLTKQVRSIHKSGFPAEVNVFLDYPSGGRLSGVPVFSGDGRISH